MKDHQKKRSALTVKTIREREELQNEVLHHSDKLISQLLKNLDEAESVIQRRLSPSHLERLIRYLRDDIKPLHDFITRIALHAEKLGSLRKEYEIQTQAHLPHGTAKEKHTQGQATPSSRGDSTDMSESNTSLSRYLLGRQARDGEPFAGYLAKSRKPLSAAKVDSPETTLIRATELRSRSCSPVRFDDALQSLDGCKIRLSCKDSSEQVNLITDLDTCAISQVVYAANRRLLRHCRRLITRSLTWLMRAKYQLTGSRQLTMFDLTVLTLLLVLLAGAVHWSVQYGMKVYKATAGVRRGVVPM